MAILGVRLIAAKVLSLDSSKHETKQLAIGFA
jgi:hypothetical protein